METISMLTILAVMLYYLSSSEKKGQKNSGLKRTLNPVLCDAGALLHQLSYHANWELVIKLVYDKPIFN